MVYIREAHPDSLLNVETGDGNTALGIVAQTYSAVDRLANLQQCVHLLQLTMPALIDSDDNAVNRAYAAWPDRLYAVNSDGTIGFKSGPGPMGFKSADLADWLKANVK